VQSDLEEQHDIVAEVSKIREDALEVVLKEHVDLENSQRLDEVVHLIMRVLAERGETSAQAGVFRDWSRFRR